jgi:simple sugar transport system ATP-binding protein
MPLPETDPGRQFRLELRGISKSYPAVRANDRIDLTVAPGEIHAVVGENGAGKSTLMKIIYGMVRPDAGDVLWNGRETQISSPAEAQRLGIGMVFQHFALFDTLTVAENIALALPEKLPLKAVAARIVEVASRYGLPVDPGRHIYTMSVGERQRVEIIRSLLQKPGLLIMDEPTSVLTPQAVDTLFVTLRELAADGCSILYISHKLDEIRALCERATILRGGKVTGVCDPRRESSNAMARMMIGADIQAISSARTVSAGSERLAIHNLSLPASDPFGTTLSDISLSIRGGEVLGIAGVSGNGQQELLAALSGETMFADPQVITIDGKPAANLDPRQRRAIGLSSVPEDRLGRGAIPSLPLSENALLTNGGPDSVRGGFIRLDKVKAFAERCIAEFGVRGGTADSPAGSLSGGNLQKFIVGREILQAPGVLVVAQPTWGVDIGAAIAIRQAILDLRAKGAAVLVISEELDELFEIADRIAVIASGRLSPSVPRGRFDRDAIGLAMSGQFAAASNRSEASRVHSV